MKNRETSNSSARVTGRSLLIGVLLIPVNVYWMTLVEVKYYSLDGSCLPLFIQPVFIMFVCVVANTVLKRIAPRQMLHQGELLTIYIMVAISCTFAGHDTMQNMFGSIAHPFRFATEENEWQTLFFRYLPSWLTISDPQSLQGFYEGESTFYTRHNFSVWTKPLLFWGLFFLIMMFMMLCINTLVRKRWAEQEKLAYPIIQLPLRLSEDGGISLLKNRMMWVGFSIAVAIGVINGVHFLFPQFPEIPYIKRTAVFQNIFTDRPWNVIRGTRISVYPFAVGLAFFLPLDLSFSCWFFFVVRLAEFVIGAALGTRYFPALNEQAYGAWIALFLLAVWVTRRHLSEVMKKVLGFKSSLDDSDEPMPYRAAFLGILGSLVALGVFVSIAGCRYGLRAFSLVSISCSLLQSPVSERNSVHLMKFTTSIRTTCWQQSVALANLTQAVSPSCRFSTGSIAVTATTQCRIRLRRLNSQNPQEWVTDVYGWRC